MLRLLSANLLTTRPSVYRSPLAIGALGVLAYLVYALNFLYFFVDDEAIGFVYAQNLLRGGGLAYSTFEGPTEGYSNFLHVGVGALLLLTTTVLGLPKIAVFALGKGLSLCAGAATVAIVAWTVRRLLPERPVVQLAPIVFLALAGPLALWSASSLETAPFAAAFTGFIAAVLVGSPSSLRMASLLGAVTLLFRIDGFVYVGAVIVAGLMAGSAAQRRAIVTMAAPIALVFLAYNAWRWWYFGSLIPLPLQTKVLFKLLPADAVVSRLPPTGYLERFLGHYHVIPLAFLCGGWMVFWRRKDDRRPLVLLLTIGALATYVSVIGDWMFGFRFFAALFPVIAMAGAWSLAAVDARRPRIAAVFALVLASWSGWTALRFVGAFEQADRLAQWQSWWRDPSFEPSRFFAPYYEFYRDAKDRLPAGTMTVNNQAGLLPFLLDLDNVDDLGITSRFFATLPTADVVFTEVGRYDPRSPDPPLSAGDMYLLHRRIPFLVIWRHLVNPANLNRMPETLMGGRYRLALQSLHQVLYERVDRRETVDLDDFHENLAHPANVRLVAVGGKEVPRGELTARLPFLWDESEHYSVASPFQMEIHLTGDPVHALWLKEVKANADVEMTVILHDGRGGRVFQDTLALSGGEPRQYHQRFDAAVHGAVLTLRLDQRDGGSGSVELRDVRVLGQPAALRDHVERELAR